MPILDYEKIFKDAPHYLKQGNCLELLKELPDNSIDLCLNDPPFGITDAKWDVQLPFEQYWTELQRVCKPNAAIIMFAAGKFTHLLAMSNFKNYRYSLVWQKNCPVGFLNSHRMPLRIHEDILVFYKKLPTYNPVKSYGHTTYVKNHRGYTEVYDKYSTNKSICSDGSRFPTSVLKFNCVHNSGVRYHPTEKPVPLLEYLIKTYSNEGDIVLDPTMGSGSCAVAAMNLKRRFIGYEIDNKYYQVTRARIASPENQ